MDGPTSIYRTLHPKATEYTLFSSAHGRFSIIDNTLGHKKSLSKFKKTEIVPTSFSMSQRYETRNKFCKENGKSHKHMEASQHAPK